MLKFRPGALVFALLFPVFVCAEALLPAPRILKSERASAELSFGLHYTSQPFQRYPDVRGILRSLNWPWFKVKELAGVDLTRTSAGLINDFVFERGDFALLNVRPQAKVLIFLTMNLGDPDITKALIRAKQAGFGEVRVLVDGQSGLKLQEGLKAQPKVTRESHVDYLNNDAGQETKTLVDAGFTINDPESKFTISTPRVLRKRGLRPLQHMKGVLFLIKEEPGQAWGLSKILRPLNPKNWAPLLTNLLPGRGPRNNFERQAGQSVRAAGYFLTDNATHRQGKNAVFNRMLEILDREILIDQVDHANRMIEAFQSKGRIADIEAVPPQRIEFADGSFVEQAFTDGKFNTGNYMVDLLRRARTGEFVIENMWLSEYSLAMSDFVEALQDYMDFDQTMTIPMAVFDASFVSGSGLAGTLAGFTNTSGKDVVRGFSPSAVARINAFVHRRMQDDGSVGKMTWHDKLSLARVKEKDGRIWNYVYVRSANLSEHAEENAEIAFFMKLPEKSELFSWFRASVVGHVLMKPNHFTPIARDAFRGAVGELLGLAPIEVSLNKLAEIDHQLRVNDYGKVIEILKQIYLAAPKHERDIDAREVSLRLAMAGSFFDWYKRHVWPPKYYRGEPPPHIPLLTNAKDWILDRMQFGRTQLRIQQLGPVFKLIRERQKPEIEEQQIQRVIYAMAPDLNISDAQAESLARELIKTLRLKGSYSKIAPTFFKEALEEFRLPTACEAALVHSK